MLILFMNLSEWKRNIERARKEKDVFFKLYPQSPIPYDERSSFNGLSYYPPNPEYRFELELHEHEKKEKLTMIYTRGEKREFIRWGEFRFKVDGKECVLQAYKASSGEKGLFVPFRDLTSGKETYGAGRYIDLNPEVDRTSDGKWILDFNKAYNPWCAFSEDFTCPTVPPENWLRVPIYAGEKNYIHKK